MKRIKLGWVAGPGLVLFLWACSAPLPMEGDAQSAASTALASGGGASVFFSDNLDTPPSAWWFTTSAQGNGYVSSRAEAISPTRVGDEYSNHNPAGQWDAMSRQFVFPNVTTVTNCYLNAWVYPLTAVSGVIEVDDALTKAQLSAGSFSFAATKDWRPVGASPLAGASPSTSNAIIVRLEILGNGVFQEFLFDNVDGGCSLTQ
jgi:hypothetical protein